MTRKERRRHKRQARLAFTPLPTSSPAAKDYNKQIQDRAAAVILDGVSGSNKRRKIHDDSVNEGTNSGIPTPIATAQRDTVAEDDEGSESEPVRSTQRRQSTQMRRSTRSRQQQIDFSRARDPDSFSSPIQLTSSSRPRSSARAGMFGSQSQQRTIDISSGEESNDDLPSTRDLLTRSSGKRKRQLPATAETDEEDNIIIQNEPPKPVEVDSEDDEDDDMPTTAGMQRRKRARRQSKDSFIASSPPIMVDSDDDVEIVGQREKGRQQSVSSEEDGREPVTPKRHGVKPQRKLSQRERDELEDELGHLGPSSDVELSAKKARSTSNAKRDARQQALDKLKRRRSGQAANSVERQHEPPEAQSDSDEVDDNASVDADEGVPPVRSSQMFREDEDDDDFIDSAEEEENTLGVPDGLPLKFTRYASMKAKELFKYAVEWFVQKKINPAFRMNDPIYELTFRKLDDEVTGLAASKFKSSVWTSDFTMSLNSRPDIAIEEIDRSDPEHWLRDTCDACNRTNHPATYQIQFQGKPYHRETLEAVGANDDDDDDEDSSSEDMDEPSYDASGREVPPTSKIYYVGKFCMSNAHTAHSLQHWRYHLNEWITTWLTKNGYNRPEKIVERDSWSTEKRRKEANKVADKLEEEGVVKQLYRDYRKNIDEARDSKQGRYTTWQ